MQKLVKIRRLCRADDTFLRHAQNAVLNLLHCFSGIHVNFKKSSFTCCAHFPGYTTKFLSYGKHLDFTDMDAIQSVIYKHFWEDGLQESASWQPLTDVRTSTSVSSREPPLACLHVRAQEHHVGQELHSQVPLCSPLILSWHRQIHGDPSRKTEPEMEEDKITILQEYAAKRPTCKLPP